ncbi:tetratricopeptide repeat protein [Streptomyces sp. NPDC058469]|uniref:tetratricopeptide repeat protein n=1 Tax=Streptomyces sp. NPDC058469 TaxID=3346514 RepID=UPI003667F024
MSDDTPAAGRWAERIADAGRRQWADRIHQAMASPERFRQRSELMELVNLVRLALVVQRRCQTQDLTTLLDLSFEALLTIGAAGLQQDDAEDETEGFRGHNDFLREALQLIDILEQRGASVSPQYLAAARFQAGVLNGSADRRHYIERAVDTAQQPQEQVTALLTLARFHVDIGQYAQARKVLQICGPLINQELQIFRTDFERSLGLTYYYSHPRMARQHFENAVASARDFPNDPHVQQAMAAAHHYLGRLAADSGDHYRAIELFAEADSQHDGYIASHGFYHQRVAEILVDHGTLEDTAYHLDQAEQAFDRVDHDSNGRTLLAGTRARFHRRQGNVQTAEEILERFVAKSRATREPRIELVLLAELLRLRIYQRAWPHVPQILLRSAHLYLRHESGASPKTALQFVTVFRKGWRMLRPRPSSDGQVLLPCPCGVENHIDPNRVTEPR